METNSNNIPYNQLPGFEQTNRLNQMVRQAYFRRSRQLPANIAEMVECLKGDILKHLGGIPTDKLDLAITTATLDNDQPLSVAFFFAAAKKAWYQPKTNAHQWDDQDDRRPDFEGDTIALLDTCASMLAEMDAHEKEGVKVAKHANVAGVVIPLPAFNPRREFDYLKMRGQVTPETAAAKLPQAIEDVNLVRIAENHNRVKRDEALQDPEVQAMCRRLAVLDWLRSCNTRGVAPSAILAPLANEAQYAELRRTV